MKLKIEKENWNSKLKFKTKIQNWNSNWKFKLIIEIEKLKLVQKWKNKLENENMESLIFRYFSIRNFGIPKYRTCLNFEQ